jgi:phage tail-like protein
VISPNPLRGFNFLVALVDSSSALTAILTSLNTAIAGFTECSGLESTLEAEDYREGGRNNGILRFPTRIVPSAIRLRRGVTLSEELWNWHNGFIQGQGTRRDGLIILQDDTHAPVKTWSFVNGLPVKWVGPSLDAGKNGIAIEELTVSHEGLSLVSPGIALAPLGL